MEEQRKIKIDVVVPPYSGHLFPILELIKPLINDEKYDLCVYSGVKRQEFLEKLGLKHVPVLPDKPTFFEDIANTPEKTNAFIYWKQFKRNISQVPEIAREFEEGFKKRKPDVVIADFIAIPAGLIAKKMDIPWITSIPTPFAIESKTTTPSYMGGWYPREGFLYKLRDSFGRFVIRSFKRIVCVLASKQLKVLDFKLYNENKEENLYSPQSILALGMKELEFRDDYPKQVIWAGPCLSEFDVKDYTLEDISKFKKSILVTNGTHLLWGKNNLVRIVEELSSKFPDVCFIVSLGNINGKGKSVIKSRDNVHIYEYIDYGAVLPVVDYVIHHGGAGILYNAIKYNKPSVIIPHDYDQFDFAVRGKIADIGIPAKLKDINSIENALRELLNRKEWNNLKKVSEKYREYNPSEVLKSEIDRLMKEKVNR